MSLAEREDTLLRDLFQGYQKWVRPTQHSNSTVRVRFGLKISQLVDVVRTCKHTHTHTDNFLLRLYVFGQILTSSVSVLTQISFFFFFPSLKVSFFVIQS